MKGTALCLSVASVADGKIFFNEHFDDTWESRWTPSKWKQQEGTAGKWVTATGRFFTSESEDKGLQTGEDSRFFGISAGFDSFSNKGKDLIVQYQVKYEKDIECGGGYLKLGPKMDDPTKFGDPTQYNIMFGPDKCGSQRRTHLIINYKGKNVLKKTDLPYKQAVEGKTTLYKLVIRPDNSVLAEIDGEKVYEGSLKADWELLPPKEISDPEDKKPTDWVDEAMIDDPEDVKPHDWVEEERIVDPEATKPDDWDDEEDGEWEPPMKENPDFKGKWFPKRIANPSYKGVWEAKKIPNPEYYDDDELYAFDDFSFVGFDLWQVKGGAIFDNIIISDEEADCADMVKKWKNLREVEDKKLQEEDAAKEAARKAKEDADDEDDDDEDEDDKDEM